MDLLVFQAQAYPKEISNYFDQTLRQYKDPPTTPW